MERRKTRTIIGILLGMLLVYLCAASVLARESLNLYPPSEVDMTIQEDMLVSSSEDGHTMYLLATPFGTAYYDPVRNIKVYNGRGEGVFINEYTRWGIFYLDSDVKATLYKNDEIVNGQTGLEQQEVMYYLIRLYDFYRDVLGLDGFNGYGGEINAVVDCDYGYTAIESLEDKGLAATVLRKMGLVFSNHQVSFTIAFPEYAGILFFRNTKVIDDYYHQNWNSQDIVAHEYSHCVIERLLTDGEKALGPTSPALDAVNEGAADVFSQLFQAYLTGKDPDWICGDDTSKSRDLRYDHGDGNLYSYTDFNDSIEKHAASTIFSSSMYRIWKLWRESGRSVQECMRNMTLLLYRTLGCVKEYMSIPDICSMMYYQAGQMCEEGFLTQFEKENVRASFQQAQISIDTEVEYQDNYRIDRFCWERYLTEIIVSMQDLGVTEFTPESQERAIARISSYLDLNNVRYFDEEDIKSFYWNIEGIRTVCSEMTFSDLQEWLFGVENLVLESALLDNEYELKYFKSIGGEKLEASTDLQSAVSDGWRCRIESTSRNRDEIIAKCSVYNEKENARRSFTALFKRRNGIDYRGAFFMGYGLDQVWFGAEDTAQNSGTPDMIEQPPEAETPETEDSKTETPKAETPEANLQEYFDQILVPTMGLLESGVMGTKANPMTDITDWSQQDLTGISGYDIADYDGDGQSELLVCGYVNGKQIQLLMYEWENDKAAAELAAEKKIDLAYDYFKMYGVQTGCLVYDYDWIPNSGMSTSIVKGKTICVDSHLSVNEEISAMVIYQYNEADGFRYIYGLGYLETGQGDVYLLDSPTESPAGEILHPESWLYQIPSAWTLRSSYQVSNENGYANLSKEVEYNSFYQYYQQSAAGLGLQVNDNRLYVLQEEYDPQNDYSEYMIRRTQNKTSTVYRSAVGERKMLGAVYLFLLPPDNYLEKETMW